MKVATNFMVLVLAVFLPIFRRLKIAYRYTFLHPEVQL